MSIMTYALFAYLMAAVISYLLIGVIVGINHTMNKRAARALGRNQKAAVGKDGGGERGQGKDGEGSQGEGREGGE